MALPTSEYLYLRGKVAIVERDGTTGETGAVLYAGNVPSFKLTLPTEELKHYESQSGLNQQDRSIIKTIGADVEITLESFTRENAELLFWSDLQTIAAASNRIDTLPTGIVAGERYLLTRGNITTVDSVIDSTGSPITVDVADYEVDTAFGSILFNDVSGYTQPFLVQYDSPAQYAVPFFSTERPSRFIRFEGTNLGNPGSTQRYLIEIYYVPLFPADGLEFIGDDFGKTVLKGSALVDSTREDDATMGQFGRMVYLQA